MAALAGTRRARAALTRHQRELLEVLLQPDLDLHRLRAFHIGGYWRGLSDIVRQIMLGLERAGATVHEYNTDVHPEALDTDGIPYDRGTSGPVWLRWEVVGPEIEAFAPDLIICDAGGLSFRAEVAQRLRQQYCLLGIAASDPEVFEPATRHIATTFDRFLTNSSDTVPRYEAMGVAAGVLPIATDEDFFRAVEPRPGHACEVLVLAQAHRDRIEPVRALYEEFDTHLYGEGWQEHGLQSRGLLFGDDLLSGLRAAGTVPIFFGTISGKPAVKVGIFNFLAAGALVLTNYYRELEQYFRYDQEVVGFGSTAELLEKTRYYLDHPAEAGAIRRAGQQRVRQEHTWQRVWEHVFPSLKAAR